MSSERPNLLFILLDTARPDAYGAYGGPCQTPHLDRLASEGVRFTNAFCASPICHPARASLYTGLYPHAHGMIANRCGRGAYPYRIFDGVPSYIELLADAGYRCGYAGQGHVDVRGFHDDRSLPTAQYHQWLRERGFSEGPMLTRKFQSCGRTPYPLDLARDTQFATAAVELLREYADLRQPWFLQCDFDGPHPPCYVPRPYDTMYDPGAIPLPPNLRDPLTDKPPTHLHYRRAQSGGEWGDDEWKVFLAHYFGMITMIDELVGRVLDELEALGLAENTVVVFSSDHGGFVGGHGLLYHGSPALFDEGVRVPLVLRGPRRLGLVSPAASGIREELVSHVDLLPTLLSIGGAASPDGCHGQSLLPLLSKERRRGGREAIYAAYNGDGIIGYTTRMIRTEDWKYVFHPFAFDELYDLRHDPHEMTNLAEEPSSSRRLRASRARLDDIMKEIDDPLQRNGLWRSRLG
ncbi:MAG: sulfatase-like hydrolase/transferase [Armatimonadetes bacterium]|nr:sulfatase-like hydrolase/transferase [Armatimonadota bacterium]